MSRILWLKINRKYNFFTNSKKNSGFFHRHVSLKLYLHSQNLYMQWFYNFSCLCIKIFKARKLKASQNNLLNLFSFIVQSHSFSSGLVDRQTSSALIILKLSYFRKNNLCKMEVLQMFGSWDQKTDSWFTNHETLIPSLL